MKNAQAILQKILGESKKYLVIAVIVIFGVMYGFLIYTSSQYAKREASETEISQRFQGTSRPKIDETAAQKLMELEAQNIEVKALFDEARNNPFSE